ncbi:hypothetical protein MKX01_028346 [Papaver californicum]|nr:hypothetical protein MKX01_028346 [Papaver californicum]
MQRLGAFSTRVARLCLSPASIQHQIEDFNGEELHFAIVGYTTRDAQAKFSSLESLISKIHEDGKKSEEALDLPTYAAYKDVPYVKKRFAAE